MSHQVDKLESYPASRYGDTNQKLRKVDVGNDQSGIWKMIENEAELRLFWNDWDSFVIQNQSHDVLK